MKLTRRSSCCWRRRRIGRGLRPARPKLTLRLAIGARPSATLGRRCARHSQGTEIFEQAGGVVRQQGQRCVKELRDRAHDVASSVVDCRASLRFSFLGQRINIAPRHADLCVDAARKDRELKTNGGSYQGTIANVGLSPVVTAPALGAVFQGIRRVHWPLRRRS
jgi:hypothetical protein